MEPVKMTGASPGRKAGSSMPKDLASNPGALKKLDAKSVGSKGGILKSEKDGGKTERKTDAHSVRSGKSNEEKLTRAEVEVRIIKA